MKLSIMDIKCEQRMEMQVEMTLVFSKKKNNLENNKKRGHEEINSHKTYLREAEGKYLCSLPNKHK